jgi:hypothetical protein
MQEDGSSGISEGQPSPSLLIVVPKAGTQVYRSLRQSLAEEGTVEVIVDRRSEGQARDRRGNERRRRSDMEAELKAGRWIAVPYASGVVDFNDPDARAILFLCCSEHLVPCQGCQNAYRIRWIPRSEEPGVFKCPLCTNDLAPVIVAHIQSCRYWADRRGPASLAAG